MMTDAEKISAVSDAMLKVVEAAGSGLTSEQLSAVAHSYAYHALLLIGAIPHPPLPEQAIAYAEQVVAPRIADRVRAGG